MSKERIEYDVVLVGGSPSNLTLAHRLVELAKKKPTLRLNVAILEKAEAFGGHICSGAVVNRSIFDKAFPNHFEDGMPIESECTESKFSIMAENTKWDVPDFLTRNAAPDFKKEGYYILTLSRVVEWMAETLQEKAAEVPNIKIDMFTGFAVTEVLFSNDAKPRVKAVRVQNSGDDAEDLVYAKMFAFGDKGFVSKDIIRKFNLETNPQLWSVGVKETWKLADTPYNRELKGKVWHTLGYPTLDGTLGGGFIYGLDDLKLTFGLVISLDSHNPNIHPQNQLQEYKKHPFIQRMLRDGELLNYGAAVLPEGGFASLPKAFQVNSAVLLGDALGLLDMKSLAGVDKAIESGYIAAEVIIKAFEQGNYTTDVLDAYQTKLLASPYLDKLKANRFFRKAFLDNPELLEDFLPDVLDSIDKTGNPVLGGLGIGIKSPFKAIKSALDTGLKLNSADSIKEEIAYTEGFRNVTPNFSKDLIERNKTDRSDYVKKSIYSREDAVFYAHTKYDGHPEHIDEFSADTCLNCIKSYDAKNLEAPCVSDCTAEVHRLDIRDDGARAHGMSLENCVQCRTCELICPEQNLRVNAAPAAGGPDYRGL